MSFFFSLRTLATFICRGLRWSWVALFLVLPQVSQAESELPTSFVGFFDTYCIDCHDPETAKGDFHIDLLREVSSVVDAEYWQLTLDNLHLGEMPPKKKTQPPLEEIEQITSWIEERLAVAAAKLKGHTGEVVLRRLNRAEFENTIEDWLDVRGEYAEGFPEDAKEEGFDNNGAALMLSAEQIDQYWKAADFILDRAIVMGEPPEVKSVTFSLHDLNRISWEKTKKLQAKRLEEFDDLTAVEKKKTRETQEKLEENPLFGFRFPAVVDGKRTQPTPEMEANVPALMPYNESFASRVSTQDFLRVQEPGWYRLAVKAGGFQIGEEPVKVRIQVATYVGGKLPKLLAVLTLPDETLRDYEFRVYLERGERIELGLLNGLRNARPWELLELETPMAAIQSVSVEGPLYEQWPPKGHRFLLGERDAESLTDEEMPRLLEELAPRLFRRPVDESVVADYVAFYQAVREKEKPLQSFKRVVKTMLASPLFLYHVEPGSTPDGYALANRLSYFLWRSAPDERLLELAAKGALKDAAVVKREAERLLADERAKRFLRDFVGQWLWVDQVGEMQPDGSLYGEYDEWLERAMVLETHAFIEEMLEKDEPLTDLIDSDWAMLNDRIAEHYGIPGVTGDAFRRVSLNKAETVRGGLLTQASILNVTSNGTTTSPVVRGVFVLDQILGTPAPPPPPDVPPIEPDIRGASTIQEQLAKHREIAQCSNCHQKIDPYGIALENFDVIGGWREEYRALAPSANPDRPRIVSGQPVASNDTMPRHGDFSDFREFRELLKKDVSLVYENAAHKLATFALGRKMDFADEPTLKKIAHETERSGGGFRTLIRELVSSDLFSKP